MIAPTHSGKWLHWIWRALGFLPALLFSLFAFDV